MDNGFRALLKGYACVAAAGWILFLLVVPFFPAGMFADNALPAAEIVAPSSRQIILKLLLFSPIVISLLFWLLPSSVMSRGRSFYVRLVVQALAVLVLSGIPVLIGVRMFQAPAIGLTEFSITAIAVGFYFALALAVTTLPGVASLYVLLGKTAAQPAAARDASHA